MEQKYGIKFEYRYPFGDSLSGTKNFLVTAEGYREDELVAVHIVNFKSDDRIVKDNFLTVKYHDDIVNYLTETAKNIFGDVKVNYWTNRVAVSEDVPADASFEEWLRGAKAVISFQVAVCESGYQGRNQIEELAKVWADSGLYFGAHVAVADADSYAAMDKDAFSKFYMSDGCKDGAQIRNDEYGIEIFWKEK